MTWAILFVAFLVLGVVSQNTSYTPDPTKWRPIDGYGHNPYYPLWGTPGVQLLRKGPAFYGDDISSPRTALYSGNPLPSPRLVSDNVFKNPGNNPPNRRGLTDFLTYWGQFIDHDFSLSSGDPRGYAYPLQSLPIQVPKGDAFFDPLNTGTQTIAFLRGVKDNTTGYNNPDLPWTPINLVTSWMDGSQIYGCDNVTATCLRAFTGGLLKSQIINGLEYPLFNNGSCPGVVMQTANIASQSQLFLFGDVRGNENPGLTTLHIVFLREHNRRAKQLANMYPTWTDEELYQESRKFVIAVIDHITEEEYLPITLGEHFEEFTTTQFQESPDIFADFSTGGFRYGHSEVNSQYPRLDSNGNSIPQGPLSLSQSYFNPINSILSAGIDPILRGMLRQTQGAVDVVFVDDLRNYLFGQPGSGGLDLTAINIQRGRDHGLPGFNTFRDNYGLPAYTDWSQINPDPVVWQSLANTYESIDDCDIYVCGLAETPYNAIANVGETFHAIIKDQYHRIRDSDPFWYEADGYLSDDEEADVRNTTLAELIQRNSGLQSSEVQCLAMALPDGCGAPVLTPVTPQPYDFLVTLVPTTPSNPLFGNENDMSFAMNGTDGATITLLRGRNYTFFTQISCSHAFYIATTPDIVIPPFAPAYANVVNQYSCLQQNTYVTLTVDETTPSSLYYQCALHNFLGGVIIISNETVATPTITPPTTATSKATTPSTATTATTAENIVTTGNKTDAGTIVAAVVIPILCIVIIALVIVIWVGARKSKFAFSGERRGSKVELEEQ